MSRNMVRRFFLLAVILGCGVSHLPATHLKALPQPGWPFTGSGCKTSKIFSRRLPAVCENNYHEYQPSAIKIALPEVQQPDEYSCGVAALMAILAYYGAGPEEYDDLKREIGTTQKSGTDYHRILRFARDQGLRADAIHHMTLGQLEACLLEGKPVVCAIQAYAENTPARQRADVYQKDDNGHYLVAIGYDDDNIYFMDPSLTGRRGFLPKGEFQARWHDNEGTTDRPKLISHLGLVIWKPGGTSIYARFARKVD
jgi:predicted double-glycine peptidase